MNRYADPEKLRELKNKANRLPLQAGVYIMKNKDGEIIYIGKAKALKPSDTVLRFGKSAHRKGAANGIKC